MSDVYYMSDYTQESTMTKQTEPTDGMGWFLLAAIAILAYHILPVLLFPGN